MKKLLLFVPLLLACLLSFANHITGGEMYYVFKGQSGSNYTYEITLKLYRDCYAPQGSAQLDPSAVIGIFQKDASGSATTPFQSFTVTRNNIVTQNLTNPNPCIANPPPVCYEVGYYTFTATLPASIYGYTVTYQRCCRITGINNISPNSNQFGATYTAEIPGTTTVASGPVNNSAKFQGNDLVIVCANNYFCYDFGAKDDDNDALSYTFCSAYMGGSQGNSVPNPPTAPTGGGYPSVPYQGPYNASQPLGKGVTIDSKTGMMCGVAPGPGIYVVTVCVDEMRDGVRIATQRKDLQIKIGDCNVAQALPAVFDINGSRITPDIAGCKSFTYKLSNDVPFNPLIHTYYWEISDGATYTTANPSHTFADTGVYKVKLVINRGEDCGDSATTTIKVYPGFFSGFDFSGICAGKPTRFADTTKTLYGFVNSWRWDFGNTAATNDTSRLQTPSYTYPQQGTYDAQFVVTTNFGCRDTIFKKIDILTRPPLSVAFKDTLICNGDSLQLGATGNGNFTWTPASRILNASTATPAVFPNRTTSYIVELNDQGCLAQDTVQVRVVNFVSLTAMPDTTICAGDTLRLSAVSDGLRYTWTPAATILSGANTLRPLAQPTVTTSYNIQSTIGKCSTTDQVVVTLVPYPKAKAGADTIICFSTTAQLSGSHDGSNFVWSPASSLSGANTLSPIARPSATTAYVLSAFDTKGCPKPGRDTVVVTVNSEIFAYAGKDTAVVVGQPLQFNATGGENYSWSPATGLSSTTIANPVGTYDGSFDSVRYVVNVQDAIGCSDQATVLVRVFKTAPRVFVPTAFTPNGDGKNDVLRAIPIGLSKFEYFRIYNRWGQLVYSTTQTESGWDGKIAGKEQGNQSFVWIVRGQDFTGKTVFDKGTVTLIR